MSFSSSGFSQNYLGRIVKLSFLTNQLNNVLNKYLENPWVDYFALFLSNIFFISLLPSPFLSYDILNSKTFGSTSKRYAILLRSS